MWINISWAHTVKKMECIFFGEGIYFSGYVIRWWADLNTAMGSWTGIITRFRKWLSSEQTSRYNRGIRWWPKSTSFIVFQWYMDEQMVNIWPAWPKIKRHTILGIFVPPGGPYWWWCIPTHSWRSSNMAHTKQTVFYVSIWVMSLMKLIYYDESNSAHTQTGRDITTKRGGGGYLNIPQAHAEGNKSGASTRYLRPRCVMKCLCTELHTISKRLSGRLHFASLYSCADCVVSIRPCSSTNIQSYI